MSDLDGQTIEWLNSLRLGDKLSYLSDFENGYYMGVIFQRMNLAKGRKFKNTNDMACKFQNFKNIRDLLYENFKVEFPIQNILFNTENLLKTIRDSIKKYNRDRKQATLRRIQTFSESKIRPNEQKLFASRQKDILLNTKMSQTGKFPKKIQQIEQKLQKYRQIKTKHELLALEDRKKQIEENRRLIQEHRLFQISKVRANHQFTKEHERKVYDVWMKTEQIKKMRVQKDNTLKSFLEEKKSKLYQSLRQEQINNINDGIQAFQMNCIRQGIQLQHDPDKPAAKTEQNFNKQVVMQRIKDNIKIHEKDRKDRIKRQNKKNVDAKQANIKAQAIWNQNNLIEKYAQKMTENINQCQKITKAINREQAEKKVIIEQSKNRVFAELPPSNIDEDKRNEQFRQKMMRYREEEIDRLEKRQKELKYIAEHALQALIHIVVSNQIKYYEDKGFNYSDWKLIERQFIGHQRKQINSKAQDNYVDKANESKAQAYINRQGEWAVSTSVQRKDFTLSAVLQTIIQKAYPRRQLPKPSGAPLYMPLKLAFVGNPLSGKSTLAQQISNKYGTLVINPQQIINQAFQLNKEPVVEDPKKKKDSKKPQEENPEKVALKQWGENLMKKLDSPNNATIEHYIQAIDFKLKYCYQNKSGVEVLKEFENAKVLEAERYAKALKDFEEVQKKGKKDSKKPPGQSDEPPSERKYFYTKGFIIDGIDLSLQNIKEIQRKINGYICFDQQINKTGQQIKQRLSSIIPIPKACKDSKLQRGVFDLLIHLDAKAQVLELRQSSEKAGITTLNFAELKKFYQDFGNQKTRMSAYQVVSNQTTLEDCLNEVSKVIEAHLDHKYGQILAQQPQGGQEVKQVVVEENKDKQKIKQQQLKSNNGNQGEISHNSEFQVQSSHKQALSAHIELISKADSQTLIKKFSVFFKKYLDNITICFTDYDSLRSEFDGVLLNIQQAFVSIINRPDDKAGKILNFQQNYNKLLSEKSNIVKDTEASRHLISKLEELNDDIWSSIEKKKNEAVAQRQKVLKSSTLNKQIQKIIEVTKRLCENQLTLLVEVIFFIYNINSILFGNKQEIPTEYLVLGIPPNLEPIMSFEDTDFVSDRLDYYTNQVKACIDQLPGWLKKREKKFKIQKNEELWSILDDFVSKQVGSIESRIVIIRQKTKQMYLEYYCYFRILTNKMDDWIIQGIKHENQFVYQIFKTLKKNILEARRSSVKDLFVKDITDILHPISSLPPSRLPVVAQTAKNNVKILSFLVFMQQIKCLATGGRIPFKVFKAYFEKRKKSQWLQPQFLKLEFDIMQQYLVTDQYCNYKEVCLAMLLWQNKILDDDALNEYHRSLCGLGQSNNTQNYQFFKEELTFEEFKMVPGVYGDREEENTLKKFIYEIFREEYRDKLVVKDYVDTLKLFNQLQVYRYGDTLMILHEAGEKHYEPIE